MNARGKIGLVLAFLLVLTALFPATMGAASPSKWKGSQIIGKIQASSITASGVEISVVVAKGYTPTLYFGQDAGALDRVQEPTSRSDNQFVFRVDGLKPQTTYFYQIAAVSGKKVRSSAVQSFSTLPGALTLTDVKFYSADETSVKLEWTTSGSATSVLRYGLDPLNLDRSATIVQDGGTLHLAYADQLKPATTYYYQVVVTDVYGSSAKSDVLKFNTTAGPLTLANVRAYSTDATFTKFEWTTNHSATSVLYYGIDPLNLDRKANVYDDGSHHTAYADGLKPNTTFYYQVVVTDVYGSSAKSDVLKFTTLSDILVLSGVQAYSTSATFTKFEWTTNRSVTSTLYYGVDAANLDQKALLVQDGGTHHLAYADGLKPSTTYYYQVVVTDPSGFSAKSDVFKFYTISDELKLSGVAAYSTSATFTKFEWTTSHYANSTVYFGTDPLNFDRKALLAQDGGTFHNAYADGLKPGTTYYYQVVVIDANGNTAKSDVLKFTTLSDVLTISGVQAYSTSTTFTKFEWITSLNANSVVYYGTDKLILDQKALLAQDGGTFHNAYADNLKPGTTYYYQVVVFDANGSSAKSDVLSFTTSSEAK
ncbi:fibronectin type III domain-containing protein [Paenibacillus xanthanilyticus]|uniref:Fibronectin type III domain-containing protein n=1 Tax=Paenibacillus xanthanilyticus TaxID=1783531 RepID=A0ABV8K0K9_9BACL